MESATVCIIGAGFSGLAMAVRLRQDGHDVLVLEAAGQVGGTWRDNVYPGCACDVPSGLYSLSFAPNPDWSTRYATQPEIQAYILRLVQERGLRPSLRLGAKVRRARWDGERWVLECEDGRRFGGRFLVNALGGLRDPRLPEGAAGFLGPQAHSARWSSELPVHGRVGVVGTGASAIQIVPALADQARELHLFMRTPPWIVPRRDRLISPLERAARRLLPGLSSLSRLALYLRQEIRYPLAFGDLGIASKILRSLLSLHVLRAAGPLAGRMTPSYAPGCKRVLLSDDFYEALRRPNVHLHGALTHIHPDGLGTGEGRVDLDAVVWCTGFAVDQPLGDMDVHGRDGRDLRAFWGSRPRAHLGMSVPGFPNAFILLGPNTALGHSSVLIMVEAQVDYVRQAIRHGLASSRPVEVRPEVLEAFVQELDRAHSRQVWLSGCRSWYLNAEGQNFTIWPGSTLSYLWRTRRFRPAEFR